MSFLFSRARKLDAAGQVVRADKAYSPRAIRTHVRDRGINAVIAWTRHVQDTP